MLASRKGDLEDPAALVVLASIALDEGDAREAARLVARLRAVVPGAAEVRLLDALVSERIARPRSDWVSAGLAAVEKVQPLAGSEPLVAVWDRILADQLSGRPLPFPEDAAAKLSVPDRFLARWAWPQPPGKNLVLLGEAVRLAGGDERPLVLLAAVDVLASAGSTAMEGMREADIATARLAALTKLRGTPAERLRFLALAPKTETQPVDEDEVAAIEGSVVEDDPPSFASHYTDLARILEKLDPATASVFAQTAAMRFQLPPTSLLTIVDRSARGNLSGAARDRLAAALIRLSDRQRREGLLITDLVAAVSLGQASELRNDPSLRARAEAVRPEAYALSEAARCFYPLLALPIRSIQRAWAEQKPRERVFLHQIARRGLSCPEPKPQAKNAAEPANTDASGACPDTPAPQRDER